MSAVMRLTVLVIAISLAGCSFLLDKQLAQCSTDSDCAKFGGYPSCQDGVCVASGLGPDGCFYGTPTTQDEYLNACSTSTYMAYANCAKLGVCGSDVLPAAT